MHSLTTRLHVVSEAAGAPNAELSGLTHSDFTVQIGSGCKFAPLLIGSSPWGLKLCSWGAHRGNPWNRKTLSCLVWQFSPLLLLRTVCPSRGQGLRTWPLIPTIFLVTHRRLAVCPRTLAAAPACRTLVGFLLSTCGRMQLQKCDVHR